MAEGFSLIIPAYNEEQTIADVVGEASGVMSHVCRPCEIIAVNDGSTDRTSSVLQSLSKEFDNLIVINHEKDRGYGSALKTGLHGARHEIIVITDADGTYASERIPDLLAAMENADMAVGARTGGDSSQAFFRRPAKWALRNWPTTFPTPQFQT